MGAWGVRALQSDAGLDCKQIFDEYALSNPSAQMGKIIELYKKEGLLPQNEQEIDYLYDHAVLVLAELLLQFCAEKKLVITYYNKQQNKDEERTLRIWQYGEKELDYLAHRIEDIVMPAEEEHEIYELWEDNDSFLEWKSYINALLDGLEEIPRN
ncbi:MAG: DUF4259 domain-containing protein [Oscillospiraceae bacterium]